MVRFFDKGVKKEDDSQQQQPEAEEPVPRPPTKEKVQIKEEAQPQIVEREINLSLLNEKLNYIINLLNEAIK